MFISLEGLIPPIHIASAAWSLANVALRAEKIRARFAAVDPSLAI